MGCRLLDIGACQFRIGLISAMQGCEHERIELLYRRDGVDYVRCLDCDQVFEEEDLESAPVYDDEEEEPKKKR